MTYKKIITLFATSVLLLSLTPASVVQAEEISEISSEMTSNDSGSEEQNEVSSNNSGSEEQNEVHSNNSDSDEQNEVSSNDSGSEEQNEELAEEASDSIDESSDDESSYDENSSGETEILAEPDNFDKEDILDEEDVLDEEDILDEEEIIEEDILNEEKPEDEEHEHILSYSPYSLRRHLVKCEDGDYEALEHCIDEDHDSYCDICGQELVTDENQRSVIVRENTYQESPLLDGTMIGEYYENTLINTFETNTVMYSEDTIMSFVGDLGISSIDFDDLGLPEELPIDTYIEYYYKDGEVSDITVDYSAVDEDGEETIVTEVIQADKAVEEIAEEERIDNESSDEITDNSMESTTEESDESKESTRDLDVADEVLNKKEDEDNSDEVTEESVDSNLNDTNSSEENSESVEISNTSEASDSDTSD